MTNGNTFRQNLQAKKINRQDAPEADASMRTISPQVPKGVINPDTRTLVSRTIFIQEDDSVTQIIHHCQPSTKLNLSLHLFTRHSLSHCYGILSSSKMVSKVITLGGKTFGDLTSRFFRLAENGASCLTINVSHRMSR